MNREQMIERAAEALADYYDHPADSYESDARRVVDALLPQVTTVEELNRLPIDTHVAGPGSLWRMGSDKVACWISVSGADGWDRSGADVLEEFGPADGGVAAVTAGVWRNEWALPYEVFALTFAAKRAKRRPSRDEFGGEDYLVSVTDTSHAARRRVSPYDNLEIR